MLNPTETALLDELARIISQRADGFTQDLLDTSPPVNDSDALADMRIALRGRIGEDAVRAYLREALCNHTRSVLAMIDGATQLADDGVVLTLQDRGGERVRCGLLAEMLRERVGLG